MNKENLKLFENTIRSLKFFEIYEKDSKQTINDLIAGKLDEDPWWIEYAGLKKFSWDKKNLFWQVILDQLRNYDDKIWFGLLDNKEKMKTIIDLKMFSDEVYCDESLISPVEQYPWDCKEGASGWHLTPENKKDIINHGYILCPYCGECLTIDTDEFFWDKTYLYLDKIYLRIFNEWAQYDNTL
tara:strand:+ start:949 stop:1500 length:552 start_codon:yes stop_codon:yes gene_type:complete